MDYIRMIFDRLHEAGLPSAAEREAIYAACRSDVAARDADARRREASLAALEKAIRRQEMQALYEESLGSRGHDA